MPVLNKKELDFILIKPNFSSLIELQERFIWNKASIEEYKTTAVKLNGRRFFFGSWLYTKRKRVNRGNLGLDYYIQNNSIDNNRIILINGIINYLYSLNSNESSKSSIAGRMEVFINWLNRTNTKMPQNIPEARQLYSDFTIYLLQKIKTYNPKKMNCKVDEDTFGEGLAHQIQNSILSLLSNIFNTEEAKIEAFTENIPRPKYGNKDYNLNEEELNESLSFCYQFFDQVADFCLKEKPFPYKIRLLDKYALLTPDYVKRGNILSTFKNDKNANIYWSIEKETLNSLEEITKSIKGSSIKNKSKYIKRMTFTYNTLLKKCNEENLQQRLDLGLRAIKAYFLVLLDITSMNDSTLASLPWDNDNFISESTDQLKLRNIKHRSHKEVLFTIQSIFIKSFKKFLELRRFVLNGYDVDTLFFIKTGDKAELKNDYKKGGYGKNAHKTLVSIYPDLKFFGSQKQRKHAKRWSMNKTNGQTFIVAAWLQHTPKVSELHYPSESIHESQKQINEYLEFQHKITMNVTVEQSSSVGACISLGSTPEKDSINIQIKLDCKNKMSCLFCSYYRIKPIADDIHKLLSLEYVINRHSILHARSKEQFQEIMGPILKRIDLLFQTMKVIHPETITIINETRKDVFDKQNLHWYWEKRLEQLWELGWV
ncbi:hypothetical protein [Arcobacter arenosus]|uniref:hypothetical protein n=1 Tax=Arcobacter arenosus TaxID=2576037 RepID=UPI003BAC3280